MVSCKEHDTVLGRDGEQGRYVYFVSLGLLRILLSDMYYVLLTTRSFRIYLLLNRFISMS